MSPNRCRLCPRAEHLTRQSIPLNEAFFLMDARVKPAHDETEDSVQCVTGLENRNTSPGTARC